MYERYLIHISGIVQGVGFRPFVYQQAIKYSLSGWVNNDAGGVNIDVQGLPNQLALFREMIANHPPALARVDSIVCLTLTLVERNGFDIRYSQEDRDISVCITPDQSMCADCLADLNDPQSRYFGYPFTNCTHCGPRYTIVKQLPYDRCNTSMQQFELCPDCQALYQNPLDRRYHAQPISCPHCGPSVRLLNWHATEIAVKDDAIEQAARLLAQGGVLAVKGIGGFHLVCDATLSSAVMKLRNIKRRQRKPFAVMVQHVSMAKCYVTGVSDEWTALTSSAAPIVLMNKRPNTDIVSEVAPAGPYLGMMLPYTPLHQLLFEQLKLCGGTQALVMTSGNRSGLPLATSWSEIHHQFGDELEGILDHTRPIVNACDDSLVHWAGGALRVLRMARGYAPLSLQTSYAGQPMMGVGAQQKATIALGMSGQWFLSPHIGDTDNIETQQRYEKTRDDFLNLYRCQPSRWIHDQHPGYFSSQMASQEIGMCQSLQHHYAHVLAVMAEFDLTEKVLGFAFDGTGWGDDQTVWGGEVILADMHGYQRCGHLRPFRLLGGEQAIHEPARILFALLLECYSLSEIQAIHHPAFEHWSEAYFQNLYQLWQSGSHSPYCTSIGRLFDVWASLLMLVDRIDFEGESGLEVERLAREEAADDLPLQFTWSSAQNGSSTQILDWESAVCMCIETRVWELASGQIAACQAFIQAIVAAIGQMSDQYASLPVVVSGGVFQNRLLMDQLWQLWFHKNQRLYSGVKIPVNDGGIAAGQLWYGMHAAH